MKHEKIYIYGKHAVAEALASSPRAITKVFLGKGFSDLLIRRAIEENRIPVSKLRPSTAARVPGNFPSQKIMAVINPSELVGETEKFFSGLHINPDTLLVYLDKLHDPMNVGAVIRSASALGASGVLFPSRGQAPITGSVIKASAGVAFHIPLVSVDRPSQVFRDLKKKGFVVYGLAMKASRSVFEEEFKRPTVLVVGNEGNGISKETFSFCDATLNIPMKPKTESLNAAVSVGIALGAWSNKHPLALRKK